MEDGNTGEGNTGDGNTGHGNTEDGIVVVGGGFAGFWAAVAGRRVAGPDVPIILVTPDPWLQMRPRLYESNPETLSVDLRDPLTSVGVGLLLDRAVALDTTSRLLTLGSGKTIGYEKLVVAVGSVMRRPPVPGAELAFSIDTQTEAIAFDLRLAELASRRRSLSIAVIGAGFTGIELALELRDRIAVHAGHDAGERARLVLLDRTDVVGSELGAGPRPVIELALDAARVERRLGISIVGIAPHHPGLFRIVFSDATTLDVDNVVLATGLVASPFVEQIPGHHDPLGRVVVDSSLRTPEAPDVFAAGDAAAADVGDGHHTLQSCQHALQLGRYAGENAARDLLGMETLPYKQERYVTCLDLGRAGAVLTTGWDRTVSLSGSEAKALKRTINTEVIYPPLNVSAQELLRASNITPSG